MHYLSVIWYDAPVYFKCDFEVYSVISTYTMMAEARKFTTCCKKQYTYFTIRTSLPSLVSAFEPYKWKFCHINEIELKLDVYNNLQYIHTQWKCWHMLCLPTTLWKPLVWTYGDFCPTFWVAFCFELLVWNGALGMPFTTCQQQRLFLPETMHYQNMTHGGRFL